ncbi:2-amino-4-hydroxy-6-hydroxymethyldihydropteridine diphosphokinase [Mesonia sp. K7]|uniref:2-amino-4-hydroxy-6- hydroxymethyldihydropteridine diphosphokinase n=1 Tax=Mesonia sp. K7 TaxID=2218606 RepID=UPI000DA7AA78|nr:2-amino-4-hydroxy-6-hydroxymethyldihydropteridine diphosphokinase [Mesonia sp. K7]PZD78654.1 2-amino-4-hydroxy-6-hydroxymethyldihydropteridine diphosphokinase [Mesonia sp. K7]
MRENRTTYLGLGSNLGDKQQFLQQAVTEIEAKIGFVTKTSKTYQTPAYGFDGEDFYNICVEVKTRFSAEDFLQKVLQIETDIGRERSKEGYQNRTVDIDVLFYENEIINQKNLQIPHPEISKRNFVLFPLADIAPDFLHPTENKTVAELKNALPFGEIKAVAGQISAKAKEYKFPEYLVIEGNIGAGKTSLATMISQDFNAKLVIERFKDNPFLPKFYENQERFAFTVEMSFLADRYQQLHDDIKQYNLFTDFMVADYDLYKSLIFAQVTLQEDELALYKKIFQLMYKELPKPDLYVYLYQNTEKLLNNIKKRGRSYEQEIPAEYLEKINQGYLNYIKNNTEMQVKIIDVSALDFVENHEDYLKVLQEITNK